MLNIGQVVVDLDENRLMIFAGLKILRDQQTGTCTAHGAFITRDGEFVYEERTKNTRRNYTNFAVGKGNVIPIGSFVDKYDFRGHFFGIIDEKILGKEGIHDAVNAIKEFEEIGWELNEDWKPVLLNEEV